MRTLTTTAIAAALLAAGLTGCLPPGGTHSLGSSTSYGSYTAPVEVTTTAPLPTPAEFSLNVVETNHQCFGSAGCNVQYRIVPTWVGSGSAPTSSFTLLYAVVGLDDAATGSIKVTDGHFATESGFGSSQGGTLTAQVTQVLED